MRSNDNNAAQPGAQPSAQTDRPLSATPREQLVLSLLDGELGERMVALVAALDGIDFDDAAYERTIRETLVMCPTPLTADEAAELSAAFAPLAGNPQADPSLVLPWFYACFEWANRKIDDAGARDLRWRALFRQAQERLEGYSLFHYARSRALLSAGRNDEALAEASSASLIASEHAGFLNNYAEILLKNTEDDLLSGNFAIFDEENTQRADFELIASRLETLIETGRNVYPSFLLSRGRVLSCLGRYDEAQASFEAARSLICRMRDEGHPRFSDESLFLTELESVVTAQATTSSLRASASVWRSLRDARSELKEQTAALSEKAAELDARISNEHLNMLEFLGFFSGIISFIIASIQIGGDMGFVARGSLIIIMLGALLIAFGALGWLIDGMRAQPRAASSGEGRAQALARRASGKGTALIAVGLLTLVVGLASYGLLAPVLG